MSTPEQKAKQAAQSRRWRKANPEKSKAHERKKWLRHAGAIRVRRREWVKANHEKVKAYHRRWEFMNREKLSGRRDEHRFRLKQEAFDILGRRCKHCGFEDERALQIDHVNGNGAEERRSGRSLTIYKRVIVARGVGYQTLCANCQWIKRYECNEHNGHTKRKVPVDPTLVQLELFPLH